MYAINKIVYSEGRKAATTIGLAFEYRNFETQIKWFFMYSMRCRVSTCADCDAHALNELGCSGDLIIEGLWVPRHPQKRCWQLQLHTVDGQKALRQEVHQQ